MNKFFKKECIISLKDVSLKGDLTLPHESKAVVIFSHGSGSSRLSSRNQYVASYLNENGFGTLLFDLLTVEEDRDYDKRFDIELLTDRLIATSNWLSKIPEVNNLPIGYFGASTGAASALKAAAKLKHIFAVVSRGGRPDLAMGELPRVQAPTLLIVGSLDQEVHELNLIALQSLSCEKQLELVEGATHLFEEEGKLAEVAKLAVSWFSNHLS